MPYFHLDHTGLSYGISDADVCLVCSSLAIFPSVYLHKLEAVSLDARITWGCQHTREGKGAFSARAPMCTSYLFIYFIYDSLPKKYPNIKNINNFKFNTNWDKNPHLKVLLKKEDLKRQ